jgi:hypothetical protein
MAIKSLTPLFEAYLPQTSIGATPHEKYHLVETSE